MKDSDVRSIPDGYDPGERTTLRLPAEIGRIIIGHPEYRYLGLLGDVRTDWSRRRSDQALFLEFHTSVIEDAETLMAFGERVAGQLVKQSELCPSYYQGIQH